MRTCRFRSEGLQACAVTSVAVTLVGCVTQTVYFIYYHLAYFSPEVFRNVARLAGEFHPETEKPYPSCHTPKPSLEFHLERLSRSFELGATSEPLESNGTNIEN